MIDEDDNPFGNPTAGGDDDVITVGGLDKLDEKWRSPTGFWEARIISAKRENAKSSGNPMLVLQYALTGNYATTHKVRGFANNDPEQGGKEYTDRYPFSLAAAFKMDQLGKAMDLPMVDGSISFRPSQLIGKMAMVHLVDRDFEDRTTSNIKAVYRHPDGPDAEV